MKKIILLLMFMPFWFFIDGFFIDGSFGGIEDNAIKNHEIERIKREFYLKNLIQQIETESEVTIPDYVNIKYVEYMYNLSKKLNCQQEWFSYWYIENRLLLILLYLVKDQKDFFR